MLCLAAAKLQCVREYPVSGQCRMTLKFTAGSGSHEDPEDTGVAPQGAFRSSQVYRNNMARWRVSVHHSDTPGRGRHGLGSQVFPEVGDTVPATVRVNIADAGWGVFLRRWHEEWC